MEIVRSLNTEFGFMTLISAYIRAIHPRGHVQGEMSGYLFNYLAKCPDTSLII